MVTDSVFAVLEVTAVETAGAAICCGMLLLQSSDKERCFHGYVTIRLYSYLVIHYKAVKKPAAKEG